jgi:uroporphyrin-3 C-methyltransferase
VNDTSRAEEPVQPALLTAPSATPQPSLRPEAQGSDIRWWYSLAAVLAVVAGVSLVIAWKTSQRVEAIEKELVLRLDEGQKQSSQAQMLAKQSQEGVLAASAKVALLEARLAEVAIQRTQLEDLMRSMSRSRDENLLVDIDTGLRVAMQQTAITGSAEPLVAMLKQADERLARYDQPRLEGVRRAIARDLDRVKSVSAPDIPSLSIKLDEAVRLIDELPLLSNAQVPTTALAAPVLPSWWPDWNASWKAASERVWLEVKSLVRVTRIDHPEAMLLAPDNAFFVRENVKLRLLNARLALLSRQFDTAQRDLQVVQAALERYFDRSSRRTGLALDLVRQVSAMARQVTTPKPDDTLVALAAVSAGR